MVPKFWFIWLCYICFCITYKSTVKLCKHTVYKCFPVGKEYKARASIKGLRKASNKNSRNTAMSTRKLSTKPTSFSKLAKKNCFEDSSSFCFEEAQCQFSSRLVHVLLSKFHSDFILILSWFYPDFILKEWLARRVEISNFLILRNLTGK